MLCSVSRQRSFSKHAKSALRGAFALSHVRPSLLELVQGVFNASLGFIAGRRARDVVENGLPLGLVTGKKGLHRPRVVPHPGQQAAGQLLPALSGSCHAHLLLHSQLFPDDLFSYGGKCDMIK